MTKERAIEFLTDAGLITTTEELSDDVARIHFKHRGKRLVVVACEDDEEFLSISCSYSLRTARYDELNAVRLLMRLQNEYKVVKFDLTGERPGVTANVEQFVPGGIAFERVFWRSADLVARAAGDAAFRLDGVILAGDAATTFIRRLERELPSRDTGESEGA